jgi:hypothetical protein
MKLREENKRYLSHPHQSGKSIIIKITYIMQHKFFQNQFELSHSVSIRNREGVKK